MLNSYVLISKTNEPIEKLTSQRTYQVPLIQQNMSYCTYIEISRKPSCKCKSELRFLFYLFIFFVFFLSIYIIFLFVRGILTLRKLSSHSCCFMQLIIFNPCHNHVSFLWPLKTSKNLVFDIFRGPD